MAKTKKTDLVVPKEIFAQVSPKSIGGRSLFSSNDLVSVDNIENYFSEKKVTLNAIEQLKKQGFKILQVTNSTINISGSEARFKRAFGIDIIPVEMKSMKSGPKEEYVTYLDTSKTDLMGLIEPQSGTMANYIEGVAIETPYYYFTPKAFPPKKNYWHLQVPADVSLACNADKAHRGGITGKGINVAMVDSGWYKHPFFTSRGYRVNNVTLAPGATNPNVDNSGHGTAEAANIFATAPDCRMLPVKMSFVNTTAAFNTAVALKPDIITCSWGSSIQNGPLAAANQALAAAIAFAVKKGIIVIFSSGNGHYGFPGQHPDVLSAGGVFMDKNLNLKASNYASGFTSSIYQGRIVPDVCGLVGQKPRAAYIMLPLQENSSIDTGSAGGNHPNGDETAAGDGWAAISGTSAAAPQLAGVAALMKQACKWLSPASIKKIMKTTAIDVVTGTNNNNNTSQAGPDNSTGHGLINAHKAVVMAKLKNLIPVKPLPQIIPNPFPINPPVVGPVPPPINPPIVGPGPDPVPPLENGTNGNGKHEVKNEQPTFFEKEDIDIVMSMVDNDEFNITDFEE